jgi:hypothetical protein
MLGLGLGLGFMLLVLSTRLSRDPPVEGRDGFPLLVHLPHGGVLLEGAHMV